MREGDLSYDDYLSDALAAIFGVSISEDVEASFEYSGQISGYQTIGTVSTPQGWLLAWPSSLQHTFRQVQLLDESQPGHARYVMLSLVDPHYRICSTRNVPPQRNDWWSEEAVQAAGLEEKGLPRELVIEIRNRTDCWPMGMEEAKNLREEMVEEFLNNMHQLSTRHRPFYLVDEP